MSGEDRERDPDAFVPADQDEAPREPRLRRGLLGFRTADVLAELEARQREAEDLRRDVASLWLAFGQHERTIRHLIAAIEALGEDGTAPGPPPQPPAGAAEEPRSATGPVEQPAPVEPPEPAPIDTIGAQLSDLDDVLAAIEQATRSLERTYSGEIDSAAQASERGDPDEPSAEDSGEPPASDPGPEPR